MATDDASRKLIKQAEEVKRDLSVVGDGSTDDGSTPTRGQIDPNAKRKAMFAAADRRRDEQAAMGGQMDEHLRQQVIDAGLDPDAMGGATAATPEPTTDRTLHLNVKKEITTPLQKENVQVKLNHNGAEISVAQADIDRAGSADLYLRNRTLEERAVALAKQQDAFDEREREWSKRQAEKQANQSAGQGNDPANRNADPATQNRNGSGNQGVDVEALAERLATQIYSGDQDDAKKAILELISLQRSAGQVPDTEAIVKQVRAEMADTSQATGKTAEPVITQSAATKAINASIDAMARNEFPDLIVNEEARVAAFQRFLNLVKLPENKDRLAVDVARDACEAIERLYGTPRQKIVERKRTLPVATAAAGVNQNADDDVPHTPSEVIAQMQSARRFGRKAS